MRIIIKQAYDNIYEAINPLKVLWLETDERKNTLIVVLAGENPPTWKKIAVKESPEEVQRMVQDVVRKMREAGLFQNPEHSHETSTK